MISRNRCRIAGFVLAFLNMLAISKAEPGRALELTLCESPRVIECVLPTVTYETAARDLAGKSVYRFSSDRPSLRAIIEAVGPNSLRRFPSIAPPYTTSSFYRKSLTGHEFLYFDQQAIMLEREKPLSLSPYQTLISTSRAGRSALLRIRRAF
jgi:hypothetical protein